MSEMAPGGIGVDELLGRLEAVVGRLADPAAPLERLVVDFEEARQLVAMARKAIEAAERSLGPLTRPGPPVAAGGPE
ncbi:MAG TPA: exodeoxyribonuclease VII small subunit [Candidatus Dormibacteraeota bacterium]|nr:exodeoxyribonuclease VII small subunit [Candidatus Dormibacteraeota bacterium]